jgi:hypothetical protein
MIAPRSAMIALAREMIASASVTIARQRCVTAKPTSISSVDGWCYVFMSRIAR